MVPAVVEGLIEAGHEVQVARDVRSQHRTIFEVLLSCWPLVASGLWGLLEAELPQTPNPTPLDSSIEPREEQFGICGNTEERIQLEQNASEKTAGVRGVLLS